jgi:hypothetical protein
MFDSCSWSAVLLVLLVPQCSSLKATATAAAGLLLLLLLLTFIAGAFSASATAAASAGIVALLLSEPASGLASSHQRCKRLLSSPEIETPKVSGILGKTALLQANTCLDMLQQRKPVCTDWPAHLCQTGATAYRIGDGINRHANR